MFGNTLSADHMYSRHRWEKFQEQVQALLSEKRKTYLQNFIAFLESAQSFGYFEKKDQLHSLNISEFIDPEKCSYFNARKLLLTYFLVIRQIFLLTLVFMHLYSQTAIIKLFSLASTLIFIIPCHCND